MILGRLGDYEILERIGEGGMGLVFRARDVGLNAVRAIKVVSPSHADDPEYLERLQHEAQTVARLQHPNIAICHHCGEAVPEPADLLGPPGPDSATRRAYFMAMEFVEGLDLDEYAAHRRLPAQEVVGIALQIASGLEAAHEAGVFHRDLKPGNIRMTPKGEVKILDFGLAHSDPGRDIETWASTQARSGGTVGGTPLYMAPEQARRRVTSAQSDLYSFGVVLYELLAGRLPYARGRPGWESDDPAAWAVDPLVRHRPDLPARLARVVGRLLEFEPAARYASAAELRRDLERLALPPKRALRWIAAVGVLALVGVAARDLPAWLAIRGDPAARNVAILEIESAASDPQLHLLAAGLATDIYDGLRKAPGVNALRLTGRPARPSDVREELGAGSLLRGTLIRRGTTPHLDIELLDTAKQRPRWKAGYDLEPQNLFGVRERIVASVSEQVTRSGSGRKPAPSPKVPSPAAYEEYLRGDGWLGDLDDPTARDRALASFTRALELDAGFALAWAGQARALWWLYDRDRDTTLLVRAERSADRALELAPGLVEARLARAKIYGSTGRTTQAVSDLLDIVRANPTSEEAHRQLGNAYRRSGDLERAEASYRRAVEISPMSPSTRYAIAGFLQGAGRLKEAEEAWTWAARVAPERNRPWEGLATTYIQQARYADAVRIFDHLPEALADGAQWSNMATAYFYSRRMDKALGYYLRAVAQSPADPDLRLNLGDCYTRMGRTAEAREQYWEALRFREREMAVDADNPRLRVMHVLDLAKVGDRERASREFELHLHQPAKDSDLLYQMAKAAALLGKDADAIMLLQQARTNGMKPALFRDDDEFVGLRDHAAFRKLLRG